MNPSPLMPPITDGQRHSVIPAVDAAVASPITETSIRAPLRHLQGIAARTFLEQNHKSDSRKNENTTKKAKDDDEAAPRPDIPLSTDSDEMLEGMPPVIPTPGYTPRIIRESGLSGARLPSLIERPPQMIPGASSSRLDYKMNERLDQAFGLSGAAPQRGTYERRPGNRFSAHSNIFRDSQVPVEADWRRGGGMEIEDRIAGSLMNPIASDQYRDNTYGMSQGQSQRSYSVPLYEEKGRYGSRYSAGPYQAQEYQDRVVPYQQSPSYNVPDYNARLGSYQAAGVQSYANQPQGDLSARGNAYQGSIPYQNRAPSYQTRDYQDSWARAPWGAQY